MLFVHVMLDFIELADGRTADELESPASYALVVAMGVTFLAREPWNEFFIVRVLVGQRGRVDELRAGRPAPVGLETKSQEIVVACRPVHAPHRYQQRQPVGPRPAELLEAFGA
ncbi:hypothetical protein XH93_10785 [Bradyrhizobium sp. CCBAU 51753]|nr:hypothetical protein XH93_10785 [Bradyrhizobium sp. CCBAU 51753]